MTTTIQKYHGVMAMIHRFFMSSQVSPEARAPGHYCPEGTATSKDYDCPAGPYLKRCNLVRAAECSTCPLGLHCFGEKAFVSGPCAPQYYPIGTVNATEVGSKLGDVRERLVMIGLFSFKISIKIRYSEIRFVDLIGLAHFIEKASSP